MPTGILLHTQEIAQDDICLLKRSIIRRNRERRPLDRPQQKRLRICWRRLHGNDRRQRAPQQGQVLFKNASGNHKTGKSRYGQRKKREKRRTSNARSIVRSAAATATRSISSPCSLARVSASRRSPASAASSSETRNSAYRSTALSPRAPA